MSKHIIAAILVLSSVGILSCSKSLPTETKDDSLYHSWSWQLSIGGLSGNDTLSPGRLGFTRKVQFNRDGMFKEFRNDSLYGTTHFTLTRDRTIFSSDSLHLIRFADSVRFAPQVLWNLGQEELELGDNHVEPYSHLYKRIQN